MRCKLQLLPVVLASSLALYTAALPSISDDVFGLRSTLSSVIPRIWGARSWSNVDKRQSSGNFETGSNGSEFLWLIQDAYEGQNFFE